VLYELLLKVMYNRLKNVLHKYIFDSQSTFVPRRYILANVMVVIEIVHYMKGDCVENGVLSSIDTIVYDIMK